MIIKKGSLTDIAKTKEPVAIIIHHVEHPVPKIKEVRKKY